MGAQEMYTLALELDAEGQPSDAAKVPFGIQEMGSEITAEGHRVFKVNGRPVLIRGGGWSSDMMLRRDPARLEAEMRYVRDMGLNTIRLEGKPESEEFYDLADRYGILIMTGWCCCDHWEEWENWDGEDHWVAVESLRDQVLRIRNRPSVLAWFNGSDFAPPPPVERAYLTVLREAEWPKAVVSNAREAWSAAGPSGVKMAGPYDYVPPAYWLADTSKAGGAFGFSTEATGGMARAAHREPEADAARRQALAGERGLEVPRRRRRSSRTSTCSSTALEARYGKATGRGGLRAQGAGAGLRGPARDVRGLRPQQVPLHRRRPVDAEQRLALDHLAPLRRLPAARRRLLRRQDRLPAAARPVLLRRPLGGGGGRPPPGGRRASRSRPRVLDLDLKPRFTRSEVRWTCRRTASSAP